MSSVRKVLFPLVVAIGLGPLFQVGDDQCGPEWCPANMRCQAPLIALQAAMPIKDMATSTATFYFLKYLPSLHSYSIDCDKDL